MDRLDLTHSRVSIAGAQRSARNTGASKAVVRPASLKTKSINSIPFVSVGMPSNGQHLSAREDWPRKKR